MFFRCPITLCAFAIFVLGFALLNLSPLSKSCCWFRVMFLVSSRHQPLAPCRHHLLSAAPICPLNLAARPADFPAEPILPRQPASAVTQRDLLSLPRQATTAAAVVFSCARDRLIFDFREEIGSCFGRSARKKESCIPILFRFCIKRKAIFGVDQREFRLF